jgi:hypothetical protein
LLKESKPIGSKEKNKETKTRFQEVFTAKKAEEEQNETEKKQRKKAQVKEEKKEKKKRKQTETSSDGEPETKKPRVKQERVFEVAIKLSEELAKNFKLGIKEMPMDTLALKVGFKNHRSDAPADAIKLLKKKGYVEVKAKKVKLTKTGIEEYIQEDEMEIPEDPGALVEMYWEQFKTKLGDTAKGKGDKAQAAALRVWNLLKDGKAHDMEEVLKVADYKGENSAGMEEIKRQLKLLDFAVKENKQLKFTDKVLKPLYGT